MIVRRSDDDQVVDQRAIDAGGLQQEIAVPTQTVIASICNGQSHRKGEINPPAIRCRIVAKPDTAQDEPEAGGIKSDQR